MLGFPNFGETKHLFFFVMLFSNKFPSLFGGDVLFFVEECIAAWQERGGLKLPDLHSSTDTEAVNRRDVGIEPRYIIPETRKRHLKMDD